MKKYILGLLALITITIGCNEKTDKTIINPEAIIPAEFTLYPTDTVTIDMTDPSSTAATFEWSNADYSFPAAVQYTLVAQSGEQLATLGSIYATELELSQTELNVSLMGSLGGVAGESMEIEVMVLGYIGAEQYITVSEPVSMIVVPFTADPVPLWVVGAYNGWDVGGGVALYSATSNGIYSGWVYMDVDGVDTDTDVEFLLLPEQNWSNKYASTSGGFSTLVYNGSDNLTLPNGYLYNLEANTNTLEGTTIGSYTKVGVIGDATPGGWDTDTYMTYDANSKVFTATMKLTSGGAFKFRLDDSWNVNWGTGTTPLELSIGGDNITYSGTTGEVTLIFNPFTSTPTYAIVVE